jgi:hypothetical protein
MKQHKWHKEIKAWADGAEIEVKHNSNSDWELDNAPFWWVEDYQFRIKLQHKKSQYLYVYLDDNYEFSPIPLNNPKWKYIGKIKLEVEE